MQKRFILYPGHVTSETDGDEHYIGVLKLLRLYDVSVHECIVWRGPEDDIKLKGLDRSKMWALCPQYYGKRYQEIAALIKKKFGRK
jgi:hypothetical protein